MHRLTLDQLFSWFKDRQQLFGKDEFSGFGHIYELTDSIQKNQFAILRALVEDCEAYKEATMHLLRYLGYSQIELSEAIRNILKTGFFSPAAILTRSSCIAYAKILYCYKFPERGRELLSGKKVQDAYILSAVKEHSVDDLTEVYAFLSKAVHLNYDYRIIFEETSYLKTFSPELYMNFEAVLLYNAKFKTLNSERNEICHLWREKYKAFEERQNGN